MSKHSTNLIHPLPLKSLLEFPFSPCAGPIVFIDRTGRGALTPSSWLEDNQKRFTVWRQVFLDVKKRERAIDKLYNDLTAFEQGWEAGDKTAGDNPLLEKYYQSPEGEVGQCKLIRDMAKIEAKLWDAGFFVNAATYEQTAAENIDGYSQRDCIEKHFRTDKSCLGEDAVRVQSLHALMGRGLIYFVAASIAEHFKKLLRTPHHSPSGQRQGTLYCTCRCQTLPAGGADHGRHDRRQPLRRWHQVHYRDHPEVPGYPGSNRLSGRL